jgi:hypothetical protein
VGGDSGTKRGSLASRCARVTGQHLEPTGVWSTARLESTAAKVGKVPWVAEAHPHSEGAAYKRRGREVVACLRDWRMGSEYAMSARDNTTRAGAKDPWGREALPLAQRHADALARSGLRAWPSGEPWTRAKGDDKRVARWGTGRVSAFSVRRDAGRQVAPDTLALKPYWGEPTVRNFREGDGNVGIIRSPVRAIALPDRLANSRRDSRVITFEVIVLFARVR